MSTSNGKTVRPAMGFHPDWLQLTDDDLEMVEAQVAANHSRLVALGEIGLPWYCLGAAADAPEVLTRGRVRFARLLDLATRYDLPVILHAPHGAAVAALEALKRRGIERAVFHWHKAPADVTREAEALLRDYAEPFLAKTLGWTGFFTGPMYGLGMLAAGIILAIMIVPIIASITREVLTAVPQNQREAVLALGATRWEMIRMGVLRNARIGIVEGALRRWREQFPSAVEPVQFDEDGACLLGATPPHRYLTIDLGRERFPIGSSRLREHTGQSRASLSKPLGIRGEGEADVAFPFFSKSVPGNTGNASPIDQGGHEGGRVISRGNARPHVEGRPRRLDVEANPAKTADENIPAALIHLTVIRAYLVGHGQRGNTSLLHRLKSTRVEIRLHSSERVHDIGTPGDKSDSPTSHIECL
jgi:hypothetical protein